MHMNNRRLNPGIIAVLAAVSAGTHIINHYDHCDGAYNYIKANNKNRHNAPKTRPISNRLSQKGIRRRARQAGVKVSKWRS